MHTKLRFFAHYTAFPSCVFCLSNCVFCLSDCVFCLLYCVSELRFLSYQTAFFCLIYCVSCLSNCVSKLSNCFSLSRFRLHYVHLLKLRAGFSGLADSLREKEPLVPLVFVVLFNSADAACFFVYSSFVASAFVTFVHLAWFVPESLERVGRLAEPGRAAHNRNKIHVLCSIHARCTTRIRSRINDVPHMEQNV